MEEEPSMEEAGPEGRRNTIDRLLIIQVPGVFTPSWNQVGTHRCRVRPSVRLLPCWILGRRRGADGGLEPSQGTKRGQLGAEDQDRVRGVQQV